MIHTSQIDSKTGKKSALIFSAADPRFSNLPIAKACGASKTLTSFVGLGMAPGKKGQYTLEHNGIEYNLCDGSGTSVEIPKLISLDKYKNSILSTMKFPIHPRSKRIAALMSACKVVLQPKVSYLSSIPPKFRPKSNLKKFIKSMSIKGEAEVHRQTELIKKGQPIVSEEIKPKKDSVVKQMIEIKETKDKSYWQDYDKAVKARDKMNTKITEATRQ
jgi:hypothetical protein